GSGWVLLTWSARDGKLINQWAMDHTTTLAGATPILALDMYEHSYHMDYGARAAAYVDAFMAAINWPNVARAYVELRSWAPHPAGHQAHSPAIKTGSRFVASAGSA